MAQIALDSHIPSGHPHKKVIEDAIRQALRALPDPWKVEIALSRTSLSRWFVKLEDPVHGERRTIFINGLKRQNPQLIHDRVRETLGIRERALRALKPAVGW